MELTSCYYSKHKRLRKKKQPMDRLDRLIQCAILLHRHQPIIGEWPNIIFTCLCGQWEGSDFKKHLRDIARQELIDISNTPSE